MLLFLNWEYDVMKLIHGTESWPFYGQQNKITYLQKDTIGRIDFRQSLLFSKVNKLIGLEYKTWEAAFEKLQFWHKDLKDM